MREPQSFSISFRSAIMFFTCQVCWASSLAGVNIKLLEGAGGQHEGVEGASGQHKGVEGVGGQHEKHNVKMREMDVNMRELENNMRKLGDNLSKLRELK